MSMRRIGDKEFTGWQPMSALAGNVNYWIYFSPDNTEVALVNTINGQVIYIMDRKSGAQTYKCRNHEKHAQFFYAMRGPPVKPRRIA